MQHFRHINWQRPELLPSGRGEQAGHHGIQVTSSIPLTQLGQGTDIKVILELATMPGKETWPDQLTAGGRFETEAAAVSAAAPAVAAMQDKDNARPGVFSEVQKQILQRA